MTIEEKVKKILRDLYITADDSLCRGLREFDFGDWDRIDKTTQAILALIKEKGGNDKK